LNLDWLKKENLYDQKFSTILKKYQLLIQISLSKLIDKNILVDKILDDLFDFDFDISNVIKKKFMVRILF